MNLFMLPQKMEFYAVRTIPLNSEVFCVGLFAYRVSTKSSSRVLYPDPLVNGSGSGLRIRIRILAGRERDKMVLHKKEVMMKIPVVELSKGLEASPGA
jgi:hypothetical protein